MQYQAICVPPDVLPPSEDDGDHLNPAEWDDDQWDAFLPDDDHFDPQPEPGDFWGEVDQLALHLSP